MEKGVHPIPFRTRKLSPSSPMILPFSQWESRPVPGLSFKRSASQSLRTFFALWRRTGLPRRHNGTRPRFPRAACGSTGHRRVIDLAPTQGRSGLHRARQLVEITANQDIVDDGSASPPRTLQFIAWLRRPTALHSADAVGQRREMTV